MLSILMSALLSFNLINQNINAKSINNTYEEIKYVSNYNTPTVNITFGEFETDWWRQGLVGRHQLVSIDSYSYLGRIVVDRLSNIYCSNSLSNFHFTESFSTIKNSTVSTSISLNSKITSSLGVKMNMPYVEVSDKYTISTAYSIENSYTYSYSEKTEYSVSYDVADEKVNGKDFYLASVAYVYKVDCQMWQYDNYWYGNTEVKNSRVNFSSYITLDPTITIAFTDDSFIQ